MVTSNEDEFEYRELFLKALLTEYKSLRDDKRAREKNMSYILSIMIGGLATILAFFEVIGVLSLLLIPIFVSFCGLFYLIEGYNGASIGLYLKDEIEEKKLKKLFRRNLPMGWEKYSDSKSALFSSIFWATLFVLGVFVRMGCLITVTLTFWNEVSTTLFYLFAYLFGWMGLSFLIVCTIFVALKLRFLEIMRRLRES